MLCQNELGYNMINGRKVLALIPARGGSKGIKDKNIYSLCGKPLVFYSIESARYSKYVDKIVVSTDSEKIAIIAKEFGAEVPFLRPVEFASDTAKTIDVIIHAINWLKEKGDIFDILVLLQPTSPLRTVAEIDNALEKFIDCDEKSLVSVSEVSDNPILIRTIDRDGILHPLLNCSSSVRRQDMKIYYRVNGSIYINRISEIHEETSLNDNVVPYIVKTENAIDIDEMKDIVIAEWLLNQRNRPQAVSG